MTNVSEMTVEEFTDSLTGFDEIAIAKHFGGEWTALGDKNPVTLLRSFIYVDQTRRGRNAAEAKKHALELPLKDVYTYFADDDETNPDDPVTESGKDDSSPEL